MGGGRRCGRTIADAPEELDKLETETAERAVVVDEVRVWLSALIPL